MSRFAERNHGTGAAIIAQWIALVVALCLGQAIAQAPPQITFTTPTPTVNEGGSVLLDPALVFSGSVPTAIWFYAPATEPNGDNRLSFALDPDAATMGPIQMGWDNLRHGWGMGGFGSSTTPEQWQNALRAVRFVVGGGVDSTHAVTIDIYMEDGTGGNIHVTRDVTLTPIALSVPAGAITTAIGQSVTLNGANHISYPNPSDYNGPGLIDRQRITLSVSHGTLTVMHTDGITFQFLPNGYPTCTFDGRWVDLAAALDSVVYAPEAGYQGADNLSVGVSGLYASRWYGWGYPGQSGLDSGSVAIQVGATPVQLQSFNVD